MLKYRKGDLLDNIKPNDVIVHCCNDVGGFGAGFAKALSDKYPKVQKKFFEWARTKDDEDTDYVLGNIQSVALKTADNHTFYVVNMIGQHGVISRDNPHPIRYYALGRAMENVSDVFDDLQFRYIAPKFGAGLAGGNWECIESLINEIWHNKYVVVFEL
jgi:O-acetyl-ADP-ribose deacetylase (regulator of RNase III)